jgi:aminocarboxymuconate-semialdehyde decarboxylase
MPTAIPCCTIRATATYSFPVTGISRIGSTCSTNFASAHLVFAGVPERFPGIRWVLGHLGGAIHYVAERLDRGFHAFKECRGHITRPPSEHLKRFDDDTVNFNPDALKLAFAFAGADRILAGSDYPHQIGSIPMRLSSHAAQLLGMEEILP